MFVWPTNCQRQTRRRNIEISNCGYTLDTDGGRRRVTLFQPQISNRALSVHTHTHTCTHTNLAKARSGAVPTIGHRQGSADSAHARHQRRSASVPATTAETENKNITNELCICGAFDARTRKRMVTSSQPPIFRPDAPAARTAHRFTQHSSQRGPRSMAATAMAAVTLADLGGIPFLFFHIVTFINSRTSTLAVTLAERSQFVRRQHCNTHRIGHPLNQCACIFMDNITLFKKYNLKLIFVFYARNGQALQQSRQHNTICA